MSYEISHGSPQSFIRTGLSLAVFILGHSKSKLIPGCALRHTAVRLSLSLQKCVDGMGIQVEHVILSSFNVFPLQEHLWHWTMCDRHKQKNNPSLIYGKAFWTSVMVDSLMHFFTPAVLHVYIWNICTSSSWHDQSIVNLLLTLEAPACTGCTNSLDLIIVLQNKHSNFRACLLWLPKFMEICSCASDAVAFQIPNEWIVWVCSHLNASEPELWCCSSRADSDNNSLFTGPSPLTQYLGENLRVWKYLAQKKHDCVSRFPDM